ncbi:transglutaminase family protein [Sphingomonas sp. ID1715]|uniref:transglutaminase family protein n=1 Tax=Sphingomonas sp. ID1715 TaxID=1656898 RepID=UPI0014884BC5|nr:transglutaminase family protein [Sphingomonas sp. ID1715]NNM76897.1 transglutaminase family protein [Sphingomonas sp. ID1715]
MHIKVHHRTTYTYETPAAGVIQALRLTPTDHDGQHIAEWRVDVDVDGSYRESRDAFGNHVTMFYADRPAATVTVTVFGLAMVSDTNGAIRAAEPLPPGIFLRTTPLTAPAAPILALADRYRDAAPLDALHRLCGRLYREMRFDPAATDATTSGAEALAAGHGVCQDFAHIFIAAARCLGIPARYVSGHLARAEHLQQDAAHAWAEALVPDLGWIAFDPANGVCATDAYVRVAVGLDYLDAAPVRGARRGGGMEQMTVEVQAGAAQRQTQS